MIVLINQAAAGCARADVAELIDDTPKIRGVGHAKHTRLLKSDGLPEPLGELFVVSQCMLNGVAALNRATACIEAGKLCVGCDRAVVQFNQPRVLLFDRGDCAGLRNDSGIV